MNNLVIDLGNTKGKIKPMNCVNNGPMASRGMDNFDDYSRLKIPYARNHDASYDDEWVVDVHRIFTDFNADENNPDSYDFARTDILIKDTMSTGTKIFYRLGASIEHGKRYGTFPPKDYLKWAKICEHIILHYNEGFANGFHYGIEFWEIWNEPDCKNADGTNPCWQGTDEEFIEFFSVAAKYLKNRFPQLKIGGPAMCCVWNPFFEPFLSGIRANDVELDFFSYHFYSYNLDDFITSVDRANEYLEKYGYGEVMTIINEWNYAKGWWGEGWKDTIKTEKSLKGASFVGAVMCVGQKKDIDMLMYYDARPCKMNGIFSTDFFERLKGFYVFKVFSEVKEFENYIETENSDDVYSVCSTDGKNVRAMITYYKDDSNEKEKEIKLTFTGLSSNGGEIEVYRLNEKNNILLTEKLVFEKSNVDFLLKVGLYETVYVKTKE